MMRKKIIASYLSAGMLMLMPVAAHAAGLGKLSVKSALGQPLNAEIELLAENKEELAALSARLAGSDAFREAKIEPAAVLYSLKFAIAKKPDGRSVLKVTSNKPINDPFLDMLIELDWATGRMVREYTVLLDPPGAATAQTAVAPLEVTPAAASAAAGANESAAQPKSPSAGEPKAAGGVPATHKSTRTVEKNVPDNAEQSTAQTYGPVKRGDTLAAIASQTKPDGVNLEQMLVGLFRENRKAFDGNNMNRLKTGKILKLPSKEQAAAIPAAEAARDIKLQSADWQSYRQKLAGEVANATPVAEKSAQAVGKIMPKVEDKAAQAQAGRDVLTLSKGEAPATGKQPGTGKATAAATITQDKLNALQEDAAAQRKALQDANNRVAALEKSIQDMQRLLDIKSKALAELQNNAAKASPNAEPAKVTPPIAPPASVKPATPPLQPAAVPKPVVPTPVPAESGSSWYENISPLYLGGAALASLLLALLAFMMHGKRRRKGLSNFEDSIMAGTDIRANTVYGTQGGAAVNTNNTSFLTDFSQAGLGTIDTHDVDPIAEAEVYMAYGRDAQAEEILKEALAKDPGRHEIHLKLLEIYAARKNLPAFESVATELYAALGGEMTPVWAKAAELGRKLDPNNPLYNNSSEATTANPAPQAATGGGAAAAVAAAGMATVALASRRRSDAGEADSGQTASEMPRTDEAAPTLTVAEAAHSDEHITVGSNLDFSPGAEQQGIIADAVEKRAAHEDSIFHDMDSMLEPEAHDATHSNTYTHEELNFPDLDFAAHDLASNTVTIPPASGHQDDSGLDFDFDLPETDAPMAASDTAPVLDFSDISLDLNDIGDMSQAAGEADEAFQEAATKLDLARVYQEMGDKENAREILQEVLQEGNTTQKEDAQMLLAQMG